MNNISTTYGPNYTVTTSTTNQLASSMLNFFDDEVFLGFNNQLWRWETNKKQTSSFPPYNIVMETEDLYVINIAVAGYDKENLDINVDKDTLIVKGEGKNEEEKAYYIHKGIAERNFTQKFTLGEYLFVKSASLENGMLTIKIEREIPEDQKPRQIKIK